MPEETHTGMWAIHSTKDHKPLMRGWANSKSEAEEVLARIQASDPEPEDEYWILEMSEVEVDNFRLTEMLNDLI